MKIIYEDLEKKVCKLWRYKPTIRECNVGSTVKIAFQLRDFWRFLLGFDAFIRESTPLIQGM